MICIQSPDYQNGFMLPAARVFCIKHKQVPISDRVHGKPNVCVSIVIFPAGGYD